MSERPNILPTENPDQGKPLAQAYLRLRRLANKLMQSEREGHTLTPTDVVHEALARVLGGDGQGSPQTDRRTTPPSIDLFRQAARAMNQVLIDHARRRRARKRGGVARRLDLDDLDGSVQATSRDWLALDEALDEMRSRDPRRHSVVVMRFFGGLDNRQIAAEIDVDERTVGRDWAAAKLWLKKRLDDGPEVLDARDAGDKRATREDHHIDRGGGP
jgi:RNA polymerase sigma factor (TIGR02999 family)